MKLRVKGPALIAEITEDWAVHTIAILGWAAGPNGAVAPLVLSPDSRALIPYQGPGRIYPIRHEAEVWRTRAAVLHAEMQRAADEAYALGASLEHAGQVFDRREAIEAWNVAGGIWYSPSDEADACVHRAFSAALALRPQYAEHLGAEYGREATAELRRTEAS